MIVTCLKGCVQVVSNDETTTYQKTSPSPLSSGGSGWVIHNNPGFGKQAFWQRRGGCVRGAMRLRKSYTKGQAASYQKSHCLRQLPLPGYIPGWLVTPSALSEMDGDDRPMLEQSQFQLGELRQARHHCGRGMDNRSARFHRIRNLYQRYGGSAQRGNYRTDRQQRGLFAGELRLGGQKGAESEQAGVKARVMERRNPISWGMGGKNGHSLFYVDASDQIRMARRSRNDGAYSKAELIAGYAREFEAALRGAL